MNIFLRPATGVERYAEQSVSETQQVSVFGVQTAWVVSGILGGVTDAHVASGEHFPLIESHVFSGTQQVGFVVSEQVAPVVSGVLTGVTDAHDESAEHCPPTLGSVHAFGATQQIFVVSVQVAPVVSGTFGEAQVPISQLPPKSAMQSAPGVPGVPPLTTLGFKNSSPKVTPPTNKIVTKKGTPIPPNRKRTPVCTTFPINLTLLIRS